MTAQSEDGAIGHGVVEIKPNDPDYATYLPQAITEAELRERRQPHPEDAAMWDHMTRLLDDAEHATDSEDNR